MSVNENTELKEFVLTPQEPIKHYANRYLGVVNAFGGHIHGWHTLKGLPASLTQQYNDDAMIIAYDTVAESGDYNIWEFNRHSTFVIGIKAYEEIPEYAEVVLKVTLRAPTGEHLSKDVDGNVIYPRVQAYIGSELEESYDITEGERTFAVEFDRASTDTWVWIIMRPETSYPIAFLKAEVEFVY